MRTLFVIIAFLFSTICISQPIVTEDMRAALYVDDPNGLVLIDGNLVNYASIYSNTVDIYDAWKVVNPGMNFGMRREIYDLVVERRSLIVDADTIFYRIWNMQQTNFKFKFMAARLNHPGLVAKLHDSYLNTDTDIKLNDTTFVPFSITTDPLSADQYRFKLIYSIPVTNPLEVNITGIRGNRVKDGIQVYWDVKDEVNMDYYMVERSKNGTTFMDLVKIEPLPGSFDKTYTFTDIYAEDGIQFYKIRAISKNGKVQYSTVARVSAIQGGTGTINIYPNPVINKVVHIQLTNLPVGKYGVSLISGLGSQQQLGYILTNSSTDTSSVFLPKNLSPGTYFLKFMAPDGTGISKQIQVL